MRDKAIAGAGDDAAVAAELHALLGDSGRADAAYDALPATHGGRVLNADLARDLSPRYQSFRDRVAFTACTYPPCARYVLDRYERTVGARARRASPSRAVLFLAGGAASGKTSTIGKMAIAEYDVVFDSNLADYAKARRMIDLALRKGWSVDVDYIHRPFELAARSMLERAALDGRYVPLGPPSKLAQLHLAAQRTIVQLRRHYTAAELDIAVYANLWTPEDPVPPGEVSLSTLEPGGRFHYNSLDDLHAAQGQIFEAFRDDGCDPALLEALGRVEV